MASKNPGYSPKSKIDAIIRKNRIRPPIYHASSKAYQHEKAQCGAHFRPGLDHFKVILHRPGASMNPKIEGIDNVDQKPIPGTRRISVELGEQYIKDCLIEYGELSTQQLQDLTGMNVNQVRNRIRNLIDMGEVLPTASASSRNRKYKIAG